MARGRSGALALLALLLAALQLASVAGVDRHKFRTCAQSGFCRRQRDRTADMAYAVQEGSASAAEDGLVVRAKIDSPSDDGGPLDLSFQAYEDGVLRVRVVEAPQDNVKPRYESPDILLPEEQVQGRRRKIKVVSSDANGFVVEAEEAFVKARVTLNPFRVDVLDPVAGEKVVATINKRGTLHFEQRKSSRTKRPETAATDGGAAAPDAAADGRKIIDWGEDGKPIYEDGAGGAEEGDGQGDDEAAKAAEAAAASHLDADAPESFGGHTDNKPNGATAVGLDVSFPDTKYAYGLPEHASSFALKSTRGGEGAYSEPYRMYNLDVFEYEIDEPMALYGHIPMAIAHNAKATAAAFWNNPSETFVDVADAEDGAKDVHFMSESGVVDFMIMVGPRPDNVFQQYASLTGTTPTPPMFALGYHQCRWNYRDERDVREVNAKFEEHNLPYDVIWLDIEHTDGKRYFTWDANKFPTPEDMQSNIARFGRKMVTIVDPHIKRDDRYFVHKEASAQGLYIKDKDGSSDFKGWCWPGDSSYLDFTHPKVRSWWADQFAYDKYKGSTENLFTWNDMNEPSVFNGPEVSMHKESLSLDGVEHREWHNLYGFYQHMATAEGLSRRSRPVKEGFFSNSADTEVDARTLSRPFVLSRSFFAGSQRHGAIWTGDNAAEWSHLAIASHMLLSINVAGLPFAGADVGGFFNNPDEELLQRWYFAGAFQPFFRAHAHIDTKRREPWLFGDEVLGNLAKAIRLRYSLLPFWYSVFQEHEATGLPVMRPLWALAPEDERTFDIGDQWLVGTDLLVKAVTAPGVTTLPVYLPLGSSWYQFEAPHGLVQGGTTAQEDAPLSKIPAFIRGGSILPRKMRLRRSSKAMRGDPLTLLVALDPATRTAAGRVYVDDESTFRYRAGESCTATFAFEGGVLRATRQCGASELEGAEAFAPRIEVERVEVLGLERAPQQVSVGSGAGQQPLFFSFDEASNKLTVRKPAEGFLEVPFALEIK